MTTARTIDWLALTRIMSRDAGARGVPALAQLPEMQAHLELEAAVMGQATRGRRVAIVTGFCVAADPPAAETDGPPGALYLARALSALSIPVLLISDALGMPLLDAGCRLWRLDGVELVEFPFETDETDPSASAERVEAASSCPKTDAWVDAFLGREQGRGLTHLVSIERAGPSHTLQSLAEQQRSGPPPLAEFESEVPASSRDVCHNMRGQPIDHCTARMHRLFEEARRRAAAIETIGIGDGGNEIGMGKVAWEVLRAAVAGGPGGRIACRIATDRLLIGGTSNWAAYALAVATCAARGRHDLIAGWGTRRQAELIQVLVDECGAVDGVTGQPSATVDGLPLAEYLDVLAAIEEQCTKEKRG
ncbi:MAG: glutamate cyclase domain-containing protein [Pirellulales bacterium]